MRLPTSVLYSSQSRGRGQQNENAIPFKELLPLQLKNRVSGKSGSSSEVACLQDMVILFACLKENDFSERLCSKEINIFQNCYKNSLDKTYQAKKTENKGIITPGKNLNYKQLNKYFRRYPNPP